MRLDVEAAKLATKDEITALQEWNDRLDAKLEEAVSDVERVTTWLDDRRKEKEAHAQEQKLHFEAKLHQTKLDIQAELTSQHPPQVQALDNSQAKLLKLMRTSTGQIQSSSNSTETYSESQEENVQSKIL